MVSKSAVIGIDLGADTSYVGYVGKGIVDICQNEVSRRETPTLVGFTDRERLLGDAALAQIKSNAKNTCRNFKHLLGQQLDSPQVKEEDFWSTSTIGVCPDGGLGYQVNYKGESRDMSAVQVTAMFLTKLRDLTEKWTQSKVADCVIGVPSYYSDVHRQALLDAAKIAGLPVLRLMNEHTATALAYGIYRSNDFDAEKPCTVAFCNMGHTMFSVSVVQFVRGKLTVICEKSDKVGGRTMTECLMREFARQFQKKVGCDPLSSKKAAFKLEEAVTKTKKILSANNEAQLSVECLMEDEDFGSTITRDVFLEMCQPMMDRVSAVLEGAKAAAAAAGVAAEQIDFVEMIGGASRVPWVKEFCSKAFGGKELSTTMNADESVARGCALQAAMLSPLYKVRDFAVVDVIPHPVTIGWMGSSADQDAEKGDEEGEHMAGAEGEYKTMTVFPRNSLMNTVKLLTFYRKGPFDLKLEYEDTSALVPGAGKLLGNFKIDLPPAGETKKIKVKAKLTLNGTFGIESAQMLEEEEYEEKVKEKKEIEVPAEEEAKPAEGEASPPPPEGEKPESPKEGEAAAEGETKAPSPKKEPEKKYEWVEVVKKKKRTKRTDIPIVATDVPGLPSNTIQKQEDEETAMQADMKEIIETDEKRNDLESYILTMRDLPEDSDPADWHIRMPRTLLDVVTQLLELMFARRKGAGNHFCEDEMRGDWVQAVQGTITNYANAAKTPGEMWLAFKLPGYSHISPDKLGQIVKECDSLTSWLESMQAQQAAMPKHEKPVLLPDRDQMICSDLEKKNQELAKFADEILRRAMWPMWTKQSALPALLELGNDIYSIATFDKEESSWHLWVYNRASSKKGVTLRAKQCVLPLGQLTLVEEMPADSDALFRVPYALSSPGTSGLVCVWQEEEGEVVMDIAEVAKQLSLDLKSPEIATRLES
ncbi:Hspa4 [Symbiodinium natans]|uniref:Hspa4 protein n=1 Tax=Symbiodinium natans TaxID=878477 RepID=A0A812QIS5_9DINO|nr:Hspa4 [Symbiodinium natans]